MLKSYEAIYEDGRLHWIGAAPKAKKMRVLVVVEENTPKSDGQALAEILRQLAKTDLHRHIPDPVTWQREMRQDRSLPGRGED